MDGIMISNGLEGLQSGGGGAVARRLLANGMDPGALCPWVEPDGRAWMVVNGRVVPTANATLRKEEWLYYDQVAVDVQRQNLVGIADLNARGLTLNLPNGLGTTVLEYENISDVAGAEMNMDGRTRERGDRPVWTPGYLPLPIVHAGFDVSIRQLAASRTTGQPLDTTTAAIKSRKIADYLEDLLFNGISGNFSWGGGNIYGYRTHPNRATYSLGGNHWDHSNVTPLTIIGHVLGMMQTLRALYFKGPYMLYTPTNYNRVLDDDYHSGSTGWHGGRTIRERIRQIEGIADVKTADALTADNVVMVQMTSDVVRVVNGMPIRTVEWDSEGGMTTHYKLMTIQVPQIRADANGSCGVCHAS